MENGWKAIKGRERWSGRRSEKASRLQIEWHLQCERDGYLLKDCYKENTSIDFEEGKEKIEKEGDSASFLQCLKQKFVPIWLERARILVLRGVGIENLGVRYDSSNNASMKRSIFQRWVIAFSSFARRRNAISLLDNSSCNHSGVEEIEFDGNFCRL